MQTCGVLFNSSKPILLSLSLSYAQMSQPSLLPKFTPINLPIPEIASFPIQKAICADTCVFSHFWYVHSATWIYGTTQLQNQILISDMKCTTTYFNKKVPLKISNLNAYTIMQVSESTLSLTLGAGS